MLGFRSIAKYVGNQKLYDFGRGNFNVQMLLSNKHLLTTIKYEITRRSLEPQSVKILIKKCYQDIRCGDNKIRIEKTLIEDSLKDIYLADFNLSYEDIIKCEMGLDEINGRILERDGNLQKIKYRVDIIRTQHQNEERWFSTIFENLEDIYN